MDRLPVPPLSWPTVVVYAVTLVCSAVCVVVPFFIISKNEKLLATLTQSNPTYLRGITVILTIWSLTVITISGEMNEGVGTLLGVLVGYVFGAVNRKEPPLP